MVFCSIRFLTLFSYGNTCLHSLSICYSPYVLDATRDVTKPLHDVTNIPPVQVQIRMPDRNSSGSDQDVITIVGYENDAVAARDSIMKIVSELEERVTDTVEIDSRLHAR